MYRIHEITCRVKERLKIPELGLPEGTNFAISRCDRDNDIVLTHFAWKPKMEAKGDRSVAKSLLNKKTDETDIIDEKRTLPRPHVLAMPDLKPSRVPIVKILMYRKTTDWTRARFSAKRIRDKDYTCKMFFDDCIAAFPELALYVADGSWGCTSSGRTTDDEYQRTMGAMFAFYWLMRLDGDGPQSFAFGVGEDWMPLSSTSRHPKRDKKELERRDQWLNGIEWNLFKDVLTNSGLVDPETGKHHEERTLAMLALTAIHDIMKITALLPVVDDWVGTFCGYNSGETINDHDVALGYILQYYPNALPSFAGLPPLQKDSVKFTQCSMEYNMGWLVQAEAPPGKLFRKFKAVITDGKATVSDVAFYFVHWLTDLAGAEPYPQEGCEKFVLKFPQKVLTTFLLSFKVVQNLSEKTETEVYEDYLLWRWETNGTGSEDNLGPVPTGDGCIAKLRLIVMGQGNSAKLLALTSLSPQKIVPCWIRSSL